MGIFDDTRLMDVNASGPEGLLGLADGLTGQEMRDRLALATLYLANWYKATKGSENQVTWWKKIDGVRGEVEASYREMSDPKNNLFATKTAVANYEQASHDYVNLYNEITFSADANQISLMSELPSLPEAILEAPGTVIPQIGNELGKIIGGTLGQFLRQTWPYLAVAGVVALVYVFREPLSKLAGKVV